MTTRASRIVEVAGVVLALGAYYAMAMTAAAGKSVTFDELPHVAGGYASNVYGDYRLLPESGSLPQRWLALPAALGATRFPAFDDPAWLSGDVWKVGDQLLFLLGNDADAIVMRARAMIALLAAALGAIVFVWSRHLWSRLGAWISLALFVFSPTMLAHGALATSDVTVALFFTAATGALWMVLHRVTPLTVAASAVLTSALLLSKFSGLMILPVVAGLLFVRLVSGAPLSLRWGRRQRELDDGWRAAPIYIVLLGAHLLVAWCLIWAAYGFRYTAFAPGAGEAGSFIADWSVLLDPASTTAAMIGWIRAHHLLPEAFVYGLSYTLKITAERPAFLNGDFSTSGWSVFFPYVFVVKTTLPLLLLAGVAMVSARLRRRSRLYHAWPLLMLLAVYWTFALTSELNIGHRHLLPIYPALMILAGGAAHWVERTLALVTPTPDLGPPARRRKARAAAGMQAPVAARSWQALAMAAAVGVLLLWHAGESLRVRPHYLAYFNQLAGGPAEGYRHLVDSSLDWGQDLPGLKTWIDDHRAGAPVDEPVYLSYFGTARAEYYGIKAIHLPALIDRREAGPPPPLRGGLYCISATMLQSVYLSAPGRWHAGYETEYQQAAHNLKVFEVTANDPAARERLEQAYGRVDWTRMFDRFDQLRLARLLARLRQREPDASIGFSILVYRLTDEAVQDALVGPAPIGG